MSDINKAGVFTLLCIGALFVHGFFLAINVQYKPANDVWIKRACQLFIAGLFLWTQIAWITYIFLWDEWVKALTWKWQTFNVYSVNVIQNSVVAPTLTFVNERGTTGLFMWVLTSANDVNIYNSLLSIYRPGYQFQAYQNPEKMSEIQRAIHTDSSVLAFFIFFITVCLLLWGIMVYAWYQTRRLLLLQISSGPLPPTYYSEDPVLENIPMPNRSPPPSYNGEEVESPLPPIVENVM